MKRLRDFLLTLAIFAACWISPAQSQNLVVTNCGTLPNGAVWTQGQTGRPTTINGNGLACVAATLSVSSMRPAAYGTPITATTGAGGVAGTLPAGATVVATNVGTTNGAYCALGATVSASTGQYISPNGGWFAFGISGDTQLTCLGVGGTTTVTMAGGSGLPTGTGGGGGGGSGGSVTQGTSPWVVAGVDADDAAATSNPVGVGGIFRSTLPTYTNGDRTQLQSGLRGSLLVQLMATDSGTAITSSTWNSDGAAVASVTGSAANAMNFMFNGTSADRARSVVNATNSTGTGIAATGILAQFDDAAPTAITENQFGNLRMSANRNLYGTIRDAAGNERGVNVDASNRLQVTLGDGASVALGAIADAAATAGSTGTLSAKLRLMTTQLDNINTNIQGSIPAGSAIIGKVGIDQTTPGTTNLVALAANQSVNVAQINGVTTLMGAGNTGTGSQRVTIATDNAPIAIKSEVNVSATNCGVTLTTGGTAQNAITAGATLRGFTIVNQDTTEVGWISLTTTAAAGGVESIPLAPATATTFAGAGTYTTPVGFGFNGNLSVVAATTGHKFSCFKW